MADTVDFAALRELGEQCLRENDLAMLRPAALLSLLDALAAANARIAELEARLTVPPEAVSSEWLRRNIEEIVVAAARCPDPLAGADTAIDRLMSLHANHVILGWPEYKRLRTAEASLAEARAEIAGLREPFRNVDEKDWDHLLGLLLYDGSKASFWKAVLKEFRAALSPPQQAGTESPKFIIDDAGNTGWGVP